MSKSLKFTSIPKANIPELKRDIEDFIRKRRLREFFADENDSNENSQDSSDSLVRNKGKLSPPRNRSSWYGYWFSIFRSSRPQLSYKKDVLRNFAKSTGKHPCQSSFFNKVAGLWVLPYIKNIFEETNQINKNNISKHERNGLMELKTMKIS